MRLLGCLCVALGLLVAAPVARASTAPAAQLARTAAFAGLALHVFAKLDLLLVGTTQPSSHRVEALTNQLPEIDTPDPLAWISRVRPGFMVRTQLGRMTSDEHQMRRFEGRTGHAQAPVFESVRPDIMMVRVIGTFDAL
ncbi:hypothetical protein ACFL6C_12655 [Myxococcota bacterium]